MYSEKVIAEAQKVVSHALERGVVVATAESCTGGLVAGAITEIPGSSNVLKGSVVSYTIEIKKKVLGVSSKIFDVPELGAVSESCAAQMAAGVRTVMGSDIAVSVTGIAGPTGEEPGKPVGTVWFGLNSDSIIKNVCKHFEGNRDQVREAAVLYALRLIDETIVEK
ncbi:MAG: CinA family protein [Atopobiaceae bacterium]|nr:CinA family protein [Atopobiaceae bacterium]